MMQRRLFNLFAALSLLLCIGCIARAVLAQYRTDTIGWAGWRDEATQEWHGWGINSEGWRITVYYFWSRAGKFDDPTYMNGTVPDMTPHGFHHVMADRSTPASVVCKRIPYSASLTFYLFGVPHLLLAVLAAIAPIVVVNRYARDVIERRVGAKRSASGCCPACGYDLRASSDRCPECGSPRNHLAAGVFG